MPVMVDNMISFSPIRIVDAKIDISKLRIKDISILQMGHLPGRTMRHKSVTFEHWAVAYIVGGKGSIRINGAEAAPICEGSVFFIKPGYGYSYGPDHDQYWDEYYIRFEGPRVEQWVRSGLVSPDTVMNIGMKEWLIQKIETIFSLMESGIGVNSDRAALLLETLLLEFAHLRSESQEDHLTFDHVVIQDISNQIYAEFSPESIIQKYHISYSTLRRIVKRNTGYSLNAYVNRLKIAEAKSLLLNSDQTVKQISYLLKYPDPYYFSRLFAKIAKVSPSAFRENILGKDRHELENDDKKKRHLPL